MLYVTGSLSKNSRHIYFINAHFIHIYSLAIVLYILQQDTVDLFWDKIILFGVTKYQGLVSIKKYGLVGCYALTGNETR